MNKTAINARQLAAALSTAIDEEHDDIIRVLAAHVDRDAIEIETDDDSPDDLGSEGVLWVTSTHTLLYDGERISQWTRCSRGCYGSQGRSELVNVWCVDEDTDGGDTLPEMVELLLDALGIEDDLPDVPEPDKATDTISEDPDGEYCVYWDTVLEDARPLKRYSTLEDAIAVRDQLDREFRQSNPSGGTTTYLCGYGVRQLIDGDWCAIEES